MLAKSKLILAVPPSDLRAALKFRLPVAHMAYRVGGGPHLFRSSIPVAVRGGWMVIDSVGFDGRGDPAPFCHEVMRECTARGFEGVLCDFEGQPLPLLAKAVQLLGELLRQRRWPLCVTEPYAPYAGSARVLISSALSGGSLRQRLQDAVGRYGPGRTVLAVERVAQDFPLPSPTGQGLPLTREALGDLMEASAPSVFFSNELCAHYFTYMSKDSGAHFILFDDGGSIRKKLQIARSLDIGEAVLAYPQVDDLLPEILA